MIKLLLIEDDAKLRRAWERLFTHGGETELVGMLERADGLEAAIDATKPDIVIIDLSMPGRDPVEAVRDLAASHPDIRVVIYSGHSDPALMRAVFDAGAWAYVDKLRPVEDMFSTLRRVGAGEMLYPDELKPRET